MKYVVITAAHNEEALIGKTLTSMTAQTYPPERWIIVDDGSTDGTTQMVRPYVSKYPWIELICSAPRKDRSFAGKASAFAIGLERVRNIDFDVIANLDADVSFQPDHMEFLLGKLSDDSSLGVAGTPFTENSYDSTRDSFEGERHVAGQCQLFRRECFNQIGGYVSHPAGGIDWIAVTTARMKGWTTRSFPERRFHHYRPMGSAGKGPLRALFSYGEKDYYLGGSPVWELFRVCYRMTKTPRVIGGLALLGGYCWAALRRVKRPVSRELIQFHRREQMQKLRAILRSLLKHHKVDNFRVATEQ